MAISLVVVVMAVITTTTATKKKLSHKDGDKVPTTTTTTTTTAIIINNIHGYGTVIQFIVLSFLHLGTTATVGLYSAQGRTTPCRIGRHSWRCLGLARLVALGWCH